MVGRAAQGQPWLCGQIADYLEPGVQTAAPSVDERLLILRRHVDALHRFYGEFMGVQIARKHVGWFLRDLPEEKKHRKLFNQLALAEKQLHYIDKLIGSEFDKELAA